MKEHEITVKVREYEPGKDKYMPLRQGIGEGEIDGNPIELSSNVLNGEVVLAFHEAKDWWILDMEGFVRAVYEHRVEQGVAIKGKA